MSAGVPPMPLAPRAASDAADRARPPTWAIVFVVVAHLALLMGFGARPPSPAPSTAAPVALETRLLSAQPPTAAPAAPPPKAAAPARAPAPRPAPQAEPADAAAPEPAAADTPDAGPTPPPIEAVAASEAAPPVAVPAASAASEVVAAASPRDEPSTDLSAARPPADPLDTVRQGPMLAGAVARAGAPGPWPFKLVPPLRARYTVEARVRGLPFHARAEILWQHDGRRYRARQEIGALFLGARVQTSEGLLQAEGLAPERYADRTKSEVAAHFDRAQGRVVFSANTPDAPLYPLAQDRLSLFLQLAGWWNAAPERFEPGTELTLEVVGPRSAEPWRFVFGADEHLDTPLGALSARRVLREGSGRYDLKAELWLGPPPVHGLPIRIRLTQANGDFVDLLIQEIDTAPEPQ